MKFWLVIADSVDYDEYDSFVVRANTAKQAEEIAHKHVNENSHVTRQRWSATPLTVAGEPAIILGSFNAG